MPTTAPHQIRVSPVVAVRSAENACQALFPFWDHHKVNVITHQTVAPYPQAVSRCVLEECVQVDLPVFVGEEYCLPPVPTLSYVMRRIHKDCSRRSGHTRGEWPPAVKLLRRIEQSVAVPSFPSFPQLSPAFPGFPRLSGSGFPAFPVKLPLRAGRRLRGRPVRRGLALWVTAAGAGFLPRRRGAGPDGGSALPVRSTLGSTNTLYRAETRVGPLI